MKSIMGIVLKLLATGTITLFLAACYGVMMAMQVKRITARSPENTAISGLKVTLSRDTTEMGNALTDGNGSADFSYPFPLEGATATIEDIDGAANGGDFATKEVVLGTASEYVVTMTRK